MTPPVLETERLILRAATASDYEDSAAMWSDPDVVRFIGGRTRSAQEVWFEMVRGRGMWEILGYGNWVVRERATDTFLGSVGFSDFRRGLTPDLSQWPEGGWAFAKSAWGKGIGSEALKAAHNWLDENRLGQSVCVIDIDNIASRRVAEKCGYTFWHTNKLGENEINVYRRRVPKLD